MAVACKLFSSISFNGFFTIIYYISLYFCCSLIYVLLVFLLSLIFSINLCSMAYSSISNNFECGFYSIIMASLSYSFNYWLIIFHFLMFEQELMLAILLLYGMQTLNSNWITMMLYLMLFIDLCLIIAGFIYFS